MGREDEIRIIAYALRVQDGCNHKSTIQHWLQAEAIWEQNRKTACVFSQPDRESDKGVAAGSARETGTSNFSHTQCDRIVALL